MKTNNAVLAHELAGFFPGLEEYVECPEPTCGVRGEDSIFSMIQHVNDMHGDMGGGGWTRERIADWLESLDADLTMVSGDEYDKKRAEVIAKREQEVVTRAYLLEYKQEQEKAIKKAMEKGHPGHLGHLMDGSWLDMEHFKFGPPKTAEELLKERINESLTTGMTKVAESLNQFGAACTDALEAIQKFTINYEEIIKKEQVAS